MKASALLLWLSFGICGAASAQSLTGTWDIGDGTGQAKCRAVLFDGSSVSSTYGLGPLEITQVGSTLRVRSGGRALLYQGVANLATGGSGAAFATSCAAATGTSTDLPGAFHFGKAEPGKGSLKGTFVGHWQNSGDIIACKFTAVRTDASDPGVAACP